MHDIKRILKAKGIKATKERLKLLDILKRSRKPMSIEQLQNLDKKQTINQTTFYRGLNLFKKAGLVREVDFLQGFAYFEYRDPADHHHLVCLECGMIEDFHGCNFQSLAKQALAKSKKFQTVQDHAFEMFGLCKACYN